MRCISPYNIRHPTYSSNKIRLEVPCGKCAVCLEKRRSDWSIRLAEEWKDHVDAAFITLTYADGNLKYNRRVATLYKKDLQDWLKRLRERVKPVKLRYYAVGEYGTKTQRPHYHVIMFGLPIASVQDGILEKTWQLGQVHYGELNRASIHYATKYHVNKTDYPEQVEEPFAIMSRKPGLGYGYVEKMKNLHDGNLQRAYYKDGNFKKQLPRYLMEKLYSPEEREHRNYESEMMYERIESEDIEKHYENNEINYYEYKEQQKAMINSEYKQKVNENDLF